VLGLSRIRIERASSQKLVPCYKGQTLTRIPPLSVYDIDVNCEEAHVGEIDLSKRQAQYQLAEKSFGRLDRDLDEAKAQPERNR
jgi:hypothetical protein